MLSLGRGIVVVDGSVGLVGCLDLLRPGVQMCSRDVIVSAGVVGGSGWGAGGGCVTLVPRGSTWWRRPWL